jgi:hypothetical protein
MSARERVVSTPERESLVGVPDRSRPVTAHFLWLRIGLALSVVFAHFAAISGNEGHAPHLLSSMFVVQAFFVISGWIVPASFDRSATTLGFFMRRFARLYPLYAAMVFAPALLGLALGPALDKPASELLRYLTVDLLFLNLLFYLALARSENLARQLSGQLRFFIAGLVCWRLSAARVGASSRWLAPAALVALVLARRIENVPWLGFAQPVLVAIFVYGAALSLPEPRRMPDSSYGLSILHAPLIQLGRWSERVDLRSKTATAAPGMTEAPL